MLSHKEYADNEILWPEPIEESWQIIPARTPRPSITVNLAPKMPHLGLADILFMSAVVISPSRPYGAITWVSNFYGISRPSVYALPDRVIANLMPPPDELLIPESVEVKPDVSINRMNRTILTALFPGNSSIRATQKVLDEAFDKDRSVGYINNLRLEAGQKAGEILSEVDYVPMGPVIAVRDETFFQKKPILLLVDPISTTIVAGYVAPDRKAETWAIVLQIAEDQGFSMVGISEDMAKTYKKSLELAGKKEVKEQKDIWHVERDGTKVRLKVEREAYQAMHSVEDIEKQLAKEWDDELFEQKYIPSIDEELEKTEKHDQFEVLLGHLHDALALVDIRNGNIHDFDTSEWFLEESIKGMEEIEHNRVAKFAKTLRNHKKELLVFLQWTEQALRDFDIKLTAVLLDENTRLQFKQVVAHSWLLDQALINGHSQWKKEAENLKVSLKIITDANSELADLALLLRQILDASGRTSSIVEAINSLLKSFLKNKKGFKNQETTQAFLNLFILWHNMRVYEKRAKRGGKSPFQWAGIDLGETDWLSLLGYLPAK